MEINPGGRLDVNDIVGRSREINRYWKVLHRQSLVLSAERRLGKTHIVWKMHLTGQDGFLTFYQDLERIHSIIELIREFYCTVRVHLPRSRRIKAKAIGLWDSLVPKRFGELDLPQARTHWKSLLETALLDVLDVLEPPHKLVLFWDELPLMLYNLMKREGAVLTIELLDLLRHFRQAHADRLRFLFTGSIGLHLVLRALRLEGNANDPNNDMHHETVPPMAASDTLDLARRLLSTIPVGPADIVTTAQAMVDQVGGFPYYIHHVADQLSISEAPVQPADVTRIVDDLICSDHDPAHLGYYLSRLGTYYTPDERAVALAVLDAIAGQDEPQTMEALINLSRHTHSALAEEQVRSACLLLRQDHYLALSVQNEQSLHDFRWPLVKRWWRRNRL